jgi:hypothetical protein
MMLGPLVQKYNLGHDDGYTHQERPCGPQDLVQTESPPVENESSEERGHDVIGKRHPSEKAHMRKGFPEPFKGIPAQHYGGNYQKKYREIEKRVDEFVKITERDVTG